MTTHKTGEMGGSIRSMYEASTINRIVVVAAACAPITISVQSIQSHVLPPHFDVMEPKVNMRYCAAKYGQ